MALSMKATCNSHGEDSSYFLGWKEYNKNPYDEVDNPHGIIQMGLAENQLGFDLMEAWVAENPDAAMLKRNGESIFRDLALFQDYHGLSAFKHSLADFMAEIRSNKVNIDADKLVLTAGATSANETLVFCIADPGDAFLLPTPYYPGFDRDLKWRTGAEIVPIRCTSNNGFRITAPALQEAYKRAQSLNLRVKGVLVTNPSNPLGVALTRHELHLLVDFIDSTGVHLISDEIYSATIFDSQTFVSVLEILTERRYDVVKPDVWKRVHVAYSLSKDLGLPGFRAAAIYSNNPIVVSTATKMSSFGLVSSQTQYLLSAMLSDKKFTEKYLVENRRRLKARHDMLVGGLLAAGIPCLPSNAGLFCWVDMGHLLSSRSFEAEYELWEAVVKRVGLNISPGSSCHCGEPGWFRVCFANMSETTLQVAIRRLTLFVDSINASRNKRGNRSVSKKRVFPASFRRDSERSVCSVNSQSTALPIY